MPFMFRTPRKGAETVLYLATSGDIADVTGGYFYDCRQVEPSDAAQDDELARRLWQLTEELISARLTDG